MELTLHSSQYFFTNLGYFQEKLSNLDYNKQGGNNIHDYLKFFLHFIIFPWLI